MKHQRKAHRKLRILLSVLWAALFAFGHSTAHAKKRKRPSADEIVVSARSKSYGGAMLGAAVRRDKAALLGLEAEIVPKLMLRDFTVESSWLVSHRETVGAALDESRAETELRVEYRVVPPLRLQAYAGLRLVDRPMWPDLYQPSGDGLVPTHRYSHWDRRAGGGLTWHPVARHWVRAKYDYTLADYTADPNYDGLKRPNHLAPFDGLRHEAELSYRFAGRDVKLGAAVEGYISESFFVYARDAHTGKTHAAPGGPASNPLQFTRGVSPQLEVELETLRDRLSFNLRYRHELHEDVFQGYYSRSGPHPRLSVEYRATRKLTLSVTADASWQRYGENSYRIGPGHPALDFGNRRSERRYVLEASAQLRMTKHLTVSLDGTYVVRNTNFPDYVPGVFPVSTRAPLNYDIDGDFRNVLIALSVEITHGSP